MSKFWFDLTEDIIPNHMISVDTKDMPEFFQQEKFEGKSMMCKKASDASRLSASCAAISPEVAGQVIRKMEPYAASYCRRGSENLINSLNQFTHHPQKQKLVTMMKIFPLSRALRIWKIFPWQRAGLAEQLRDNTIALYKKCAEYALSKGYHHCRYQV